MKLQVAMAVSLFISCSSAVALTPQGAAPKARIEGIVLKAGTKDPISGVQVSAIRVTNYTGPIASQSGVLRASFSSEGPPPPPPPPPPGGGAGAATGPALTAIAPVRTDRDGKFVISDLDPGSYRLSFVTPAYVRQQYGQRTFSGQGIVLTLTAGQAMKDIVMNLTLTGNISGRIRDSEGQPAAGVPVQLLKPAYNAGGQRIFQSAGQTRTNDRGEYRIYWVTPGRYYVAAGSPPGPAVGGVGAGQPATPNDPGYSYLFSFFPGVTDVAIATSIEVASGSEAIGDFSISSQQVFIVRGRAIDAATNLPPPSLRASLSFAMITGGGASWTMATPYNASTGVFEIRDVVPGSYLLQVTAPSSNARMPLEVKANMPEFPIVLGNTVTLPGRVAFEGLDQSGVERIRVQLRTASGFATFITGITGNEGTFQIENTPPGEYRVGIAPSGDYFIKEARFDRNDVLTEPMKFSGTLSAGAGLEIVLSRSVGQISGLVTDEKLQSVAGVQVVLVPEKNRDRTELFKSVTTDERGRFLLAGITPGDYRLYSWESLENFGYFDAQVLREAEPFGKLVHVAESSMQQLDVRMIPASR